MIKHLFVSGAPVYVLAKHGRSTTKIPGIVKSMASDTFIRVYVSNACDAVYMQADRVEPAPFTERHDHIHKGCKHCLKEPELMEIKFNINFYRRKHNE